MSCRLEILFLSQQTLHFVVVGSVSWFKVLNFGILTLLNAY